MCFVQQSKSYDCGDDLKTALSSATDNCLPYACVVGVTSTVGAPLSSHYTESLGVIRHQLYVEHKSKRTQGFWWAWVWWPWPHFYGYGFSSVEKIGQKIWWSLIVPPCQKNIGTSSFLCILVSAVLSHLCNNYAIWVDSEWNNICERSVSIQPYKPIETDRCTLKNWHTLCTIFTLLVTVFSCLHYVLLLYRSSVNIAVIRNVRQYISFTRTQPWALEFLFSSGTMDFVAVYLQLINNLKLNLVDNILFVSCKNCGN